MKLLQKNNIGHRLLSAALAFSLAASTCLPALGAEPSAKEGTAQTISIKSEEDLRKLALGSTSDSYSKNKTFVLEKDIDLDGKHFPSISIFAGTFDGNGHTISGFTLTESGSDLGFFRSIEKTGIVRNLTLSANIKPEKSMTNIGGIAGVNHGTIASCTFEGTLLAKTKGGGIAGYNSESGKIIDCINYAELAGNRKIGGIAGLNEGLIENCQNNGKINTVSQTVSELSGEDAPSLLSKEGTPNKDSNKIIYIGGIAGYSSGTIKDCTNSGPIGYPHTGYSIGGVVGCHKGALMNCKNTGIIYGRKNIGGIAGQLEPDLKTIYEQDSVDRFRDQSDEMENIMDDLADITDNASDKNSTNFDNVYNQLEQIHDAVRWHKDYYLKESKNFLEDLDDWMRDVKKALRQLGIDSNNKEIQELLDAIEANMHKLEELIGQLGGGTQPVSDQSIEEAIADTRTDSRNVLKVIREILATMREMTGQIKQLIKLVGEAAGDLPEDAEEAVELLEDLVNLMQETMDDLQDDVKFTDDEITELLDDLSDYIWRTKEDLQDSKNEIKDQLDVVREQLKLMKDTTADGLDALKDKLEKDHKELDDWYIDRSDDESTASSGFISHCFNQGAVEADINGGGIAGTMGLEFDPATDNSPEEVGEKSLRYDHYARATLLDCENVGTVTVKNSYAGGIVGRSNVGAVIRCENYGAVEATNGSYAGGIAGKSHYLIRNSYALCDIRGNDYVGGISGLGMDTIENASMVGIYSETGDKIGSILGDVEDDGKIIQNSFVDHGVAAVNNLTYVNQAKAVSYDDLLKMKGTPAKFSSFTIQFVADNQVIKEISCKYGDSIPDDQIPQVPEHPGKAGQWENKNLSFINRNIVVKAIYTDWVTTIATQEETPVIMISSNFRENTSLTCTPIDLDKIPAAEGFQPQSAYHIQINSSTPLPNSPLRVRVLADKQKAKNVLTWSAEGEAKVIPAEKDGHYLVFTADADTEYFAVMKTAGIPFWAICLISMGGILILVVFSLKKKKEKKAPSSSEKDTEKQLANSAEK